MKKFRYWCQKCKEEFFSDKLNMNERCEICGEMMALDWEA